MDSFARPSLASLRDTQVDGASALIGLARPPRSCSDRNGFERRTRTRSAD